MDGEVKRCPWYPLVATLVVACVCQWLAWALCLGVPVVAMFLPEEKGWLIDINRGGSGPLPGPLIIFALVSGHVFFALSFSLFVIAFYLYLDSKTA